MWIIFFRFLKTWIPVKWCLFLIILLKVALDEGRIWSAERIDLLKLAVRLKCCILFDWSVMLEHRNFFYRRTCTSAAVGFRWNCWSRTFAITFHHSWWEQNTAALRPLSPALVFWQTLASCRSFVCRSVWWACETPPAATSCGLREESCWLPKWCFSVILEGGRWRLSLGANK